MEELKKQIEIQKLQIEGLKTQIDFINIENANNIYEHVKYIEELEQFNKDLMDLAKKQDDLILQLKRW